MSMTEFSTSPADKSRKAVAKILQVLKSDGKQGQIAVATGTSDSTMSRLVNDHLDAIVTVLYHAGFKVVDSDQKCFPAKEVEAWYSAYRKQVMHSETADELCGGCE